MAAGLPAYLLASSGPGQFCVSCFRRSIFRVYRYINQGHVFCFEVCLVLSLPFAFILTPAGPRERFPNLRVLLCGCGLVCAVCWSPLLTPLVVVCKAGMYACQLASMRVLPQSCRLNCWQRFRSTLFSVNQRVQRVVTARQPNLACVCWCHPHQPSCFTAVWLARCGLACVAVVWLALLLCSTVGMGGICFARRCTCLFAHRWARHGRCDGSHYQPEPASELIVCTHLNQLPQLTSLGLIAVAVFMGVVGGRAMLLWECSKVPAVLDLL
jgi:hypothetical protein